MAEIEKSLLRFENVTVRFGDVVALNGMSFDVKTGETRIILGAAGSGKTVLLKTAMGLNAASDGKVFLFDEDVTHMPERQMFAIRRKIGMLFQESALFDSMTIAQNVAYPLLTDAEVNPKARMPRDKMEGAVRDSLRFVELEQTLEKYPSELSGRHAAARGHRACGGDETAAAALRFADRRPRSHHRSHHHGAHRQRARRGQYNGSGGYSSLSGRESGGQLPLQSGQWPARSCGGERGERDGEQYDLHGAERGPPGLRRKTEGTRSIHRFVCIEVRKASRKGSGLKTIWHRNNE
jgi:predicted ABC-type transport system involved in lysophospholipase L1 biosynthesis ATPase subunit